MNPSLKRAWFFVAALSVFLVPVQGFAEELTGCQKADAIWNDKVVPTIYKGKLPKLQSIKITDFLRIASPSFLAKSFTNDGDELTVGRKKIIHALGSVVRMKFDVTGAPAKHKYTGIFQSGVDCVIARLSLAAKPSKTVSIPAIAVKFFLDGKEQSVNIHVMNTIDGQTGFNFFEKTFSNRLEPSKSFVRRTAAKAFARGMRFLGAEDANPDHLSIEHLSAFRSNGRAEETPLAPIKIVLRPSKYAEGLMKNATRKDDFRKELAQFKKGETMYEVWSSENDDKDWVYLGALVTTSDMVASQYADEKLYFKHSTKLKK